MKASEIRDLSTDALQAKINDAREELMKMRFKQVTGELTDFTRLSAVRHDIASMLTIVHQRMLAAQEGEK